jgi:hypothetical protein
MRPNGRDDVKFHGVKLNGTIWKSQMVVFLKGKGLYDFISEENFVNKVEHTKVPEVMMEKFYVTLSRIAICLEHDQFNWIQGSCRQLLPGSRL